MRTVEERSKTTIGRFWNFFDDVPLWSGKEWESMEAADIARFFEEEAFPDVISDFMRQHGALFKPLNLIQRLYCKLRGLEVPKAPTVEELRIEVIQACRRLADRAEVNQHRPFYIGSDMSPYISKPREVANILEMTAKQAR
jgi:hypothetical protein